MLTVMAVNRLLGVLTLLASVSVLLAVLRAFTSRPEAAEAEWWIRWSFAVVSVATLGSLYYSEQAGFAPCLLCWYQRIAIYPQVIILGVASLRRDLSVWASAAPLALIGAGLSLWHVVVERTPASGACSSELPCSTMWVNEFGFITIPVMALVTSLTVIGSSMVAMKVSRS